MLGAGAGGLLLVAGGTWWLLSPAPAAPPERLKQALMWLDSGRDNGARELVEKLADERYQDVDFPGGIDFVLGMCHFREALQRSQADAGSAYAAAATFLKEAERRGIPAVRLPEWVFAMGVSLHRLNDRAAAIPLLEEACHPAAPRHREASRLLIELYLDPTWRTPARLLSAYNLNQRLTSEPGPPDELFEDQVREVELLLALQRLDEAATSLEQLTADESNAGRIVVLQAQLHLAREEFVSAVRVLEKVAREDLLSRSVPRQACFLTGLASERRVQQLRPSGDKVEVSPQAVAEADECRQRAIEFFRKTINRYEGTDEAVAAQMHLGRLQQEDGAFEKSLQLFGSALRSVSRSEEYSNRWVSLEEFRQRILLAWNTWIDGGNFREAIALADLMVTAFPRDQAYELAARARQKWAELAELKSEEATTTERTSREAERLQRWRESATAYARLAESRRTAANYLDAVWQAAEHYYRGHDFKSALEFVDRFLEEESAAMRPVALVRRGQILMDLDRLPEAEQNFRQVRKVHPRSPAAFTADFQLAVCRLEQDDPAAAEQVWRGILKSSQLSPQALEWRDSLLALAQLQYDRASWARRQLESRDLKPAAVQTLWTQVNDLSRESTALLEEYLSRYPQSVEISRVQYLLAKSLQLQGDLWQRQQQYAETDNVRQQAQLQHQQVLERAVARLQEVRESLAPLAEQDRLTPLQRQIYANAWFELPHSLFSLGQYQSANTAYAAAIHRFPKDVRVLSAYVQMAEGYARMNRPVEARSMLEQAKVILDQDQIPTAAFQAATTSLTRNEWEAWLNRARTVHQE